MKKTYLWGIGGIIVGIIVGKAGGFRSALHRL